MTVTCKVAVRYMDGTCPQWRLRIHLLNAVVYIIQFNMHGSSQGGRKCLSHWVPRKTSRFIAWVDDCLQGRTGASRSTAGQQKAACIMRTYPWIEVTNKLLGHSDRIETQSKFAGRNGTWHIRLTGCCGSLPWRRKSWNADATSVPAWKKQGSFLRRDVRVSDSSHLGSKITPSQF